MATVLSGVPIGTIVAYVGPDPTARQADHWFPCTGPVTPNWSGTLDKNTYVALGNLLGETFGPYDGDQFWLPNLQGQFLRGVDPTNAIDPDGAQRFLQGNTQEIVGPVVGSVQGDAFQRHNHSEALCWGGNAATYSSGDYGCAGPMGMAGTSTETRPKNVYVYYLIYAGIPVAGTFHNQTSPERMTP
jgi:hypothetical protein